MKKLFVTLFLFLLIFNQSYADIPHYLDFKFILNQSEAGKKAQDFLKNKLDKGIKSLKDKEKNTRRRKKGYPTKKIISSEEYKKKVSDLRKKVSSLQKERNKLLETVANQRNDARNSLLKNLNPIVKQYMQEKNIRMVIDKKDILLADDELDITKDIITLLNKKLTSIKLK